MLEGAAFTSQIQISWVYCNYFIYIVREWIKGTFWRAPALHEGEGFYVDGSALCGQNGATASLGFYAVKPEQIHHTDSRNLPCVRTLYNVPP